MASGPRGADLFQDVREFLPRLAVRTVFDVGANVGQSAREYLAAWPDAVIHSFEPLPSTFERLRDELRGEPRVTPVAVGLSDREGTAHMDPGASSDAARVTDGPGEKAAMTTLDAYCRGAGVERIDFLKIDTEGHDLKVLEGGGEMLARDAVALFQVEAGLNPGNDLHVPLERLKAHAEARGYRLFGLYEQVWEWPTGEPHLRRSNAVFASPATIAGNLREPGL